MPKRTKLSLGDFKVQSFITELDDKKATEVKGGCYQTDYRSGCPTDPATGDFLFCCIISDTYHDCP